MKRDRESGHFSAPHTVIEGIEAYFEEEPTREDEVSFARRSMSEIVDGVRREKSGVQSKPTREEPNAQTGVLNDLYYPLKLNNLRLKDDAQPYFFDLETISLPDRERHVRRLSSRFSRTMAKREGFICFITAGRGAGKTTFLGEVYKQLDQRFQDLFTLSVDSGHVRPFSALLHILAQRFYLMENAPPDVRMHQIRGAMESILPDPVHVEETSKEVDALFTRYSMEDVNWDIDAEIERIIPVVLAIFRADLKKNRMLILLDDADHMEQATIRLFQRLCVNSPDLGLCIALTYNDLSMLPTMPVHSKAIRYALPSLSDLDLELFAHYLLERLSETRETLVIPKGLCRLIAQKSFGSPVIAQNIVGQFFRPDNVIHWGGVAKRLREIPPPPHFEMALENKLKQISEAEWQCLLTASVIEARFNCHFLAYLLSTIDEPLGQGHWKIDNAHASITTILDLLYEKGFLVLAEGQIWSNAREYVFKREIERQWIYRHVLDGQREAFHAHCARWLSVHTDSTPFREQIARHWEQSGHKSYASMNYRAAADDARLSGRFLEASKLYDLALSTQSYANPIVAIDIYLQQAWCNHKLSRSNEAYAQNLNAYRLSLKHRGYAKAAHALAQSAFILFNFGAFRRARVMLRKARALLRREFNPLVECIILEGLACYHLQGLETKQAAHFLVQSQRLRKKHGLENSATLHLQSMLHIARGDLALAFKLQEQRFQLCQRTEDLIGMGESYQGLANIYYELGNTAKALEFWNKALGIAQEQGDLSLLSQLLNEIAEGALLIGALKTAKMSLNQSVELAVKAKNRPLIARCLKNKASLMLSECNYERAYFSLKKSLTMAQKLGDPLLIAENLYLLARLFSQPSQPYYDMARADRYFAGNLRILEQKENRLGLAKGLSDYAEFLLTAHQNIRALNLYKRSHKLYTELRHYKAAEAVLHTIEILEGKRLRPPSSH